VNKGITDELMADSTPFDRYFSAYLSLQLRRTFTADEFGEEWSSPEQEVERLELGRTIQWDARIWEDEYDDEL
jgi:hypothetical protein